MKSKSSYHVIGLILAVPVFGISIWAALHDPSQLNPWRRPSGFLDLNLWFFVLPQLVCSTGIILTGALAMFSSRKHDA